MDEDSPILAQMSSPAQLLPLLPMLGLMVASLTIGRAEAQMADGSSPLQGARAATAVHRTDWRAALRAEFKAIPAAPPNPPVQPEIMAATPADPDVVVLPKYVVRETVPDRQLEQALRPANKSPSPVAKKLGIGRHEVKFRRFSIGCETIFFIPVAGGITW